MLYRDLANSGTRLAKGTAMSDLAHSIPNRIRALRAERGWSLAELARRADTSPPQIMRIERSERQLTVDWIERFARAFEISPLELAFDTTTAAVSEIPLIGDIRAGNWQEAVEVTHETISVPRSMARHNWVFALRVQGNSMNKIIPEGGVVIVDPEDLDLLEGKVYAIMNDEGEATVKRFRTGPARFEPVSTDPSHEVIALGRSPFQVIGRVTGVIAEL